MEECFNPLSQSEVLICQENGKRDTIQKALNKYKAPKILNSDQGSQYTSQNTIDLFLLY